jgi:hypothetical protein
MPLKNLENLVKTGDLKKEPRGQKEFNGLVNSGRTLLADARKSTLAIESRFDLAYSASHAFALAALRWHGYRPKNRYLVFQCLQHTLDFKPEEWRVLDLCHNRRNRAEYEGDLEVDEQLMADLIRVTQLLLEKVSELRRIK